MFFPTLFFDRVLFFSSIFYLFFFVFFFVISSSCPIFLPFPFAPPLVPHFLQMLCFIFLVWLKVRGLVVCTKVIHKRRIDGESDELRDQRINRMTVPLKRRVVASKLNPWNYCWWRSNNEFRTGAGVTFTVLLFFLNGRRT